MMHIGFDNEMKNLKLFKTTLSVGWMVADAHDDHTDDENFHFFCLCKKLLFTFEKKGI